MMDRLQRILSISIPIERSGLQRFRSKKLLVLHAAALYVKPPQKA
jgi:hypothetical protein